ncbi:MAG: phosphohistidine phosphatase SixA [Spirulina sp. SIO3F2]|nr:phosphohistidine phosphatase SixA [Spirulina sp. SIO3F2]
MDLFLIRHGIARDRALCSSDAERPLTSTGKKRTQKVAQRLADCGARFDLILTSPLLRAKQTADILLAAGLSQAVEVFTPLAPMGDLQLWVNWNQVYTYHSVALVGHQPDLGLWAEQLIWAHAPEKLIVKKAGVIGLKVGDRGSPIGSSELFLLTAPKWFL